MATEAAKRPSISNGRPSTFNAADYRRTSTTGGQTSNRNPINLRLYKVLNSTFDDPSSLEALSTIDAFYSSTPTTGQVTINGAAAERTGEDLVENEDGLEPPTTNYLAGEGAAARARRALRRDGEEKLAEGSRKFLEAFSDVDKKLDMLQKHVSEMHTRCDEVQKSLDEANGSTKYLLERAEGLRNQRTSTQLRSTLISLFLSRFTLSQAEALSLTSRDIPPGPLLFSSLDRLQSIRTSCRTLLGGDGTQAGEDIMRKTNEQLDVGYEKMLKFVLWEVRSLGSKGADTGMEVSSILRECVRRLRLRKNMLKEATQTLSSLRSSSLLSSFLDALTRGGPSGLPRPIELHAHDPQRYVGDMLAWIHQATAGEREFLESLFGVKEEGRRMGSVRKEFVTSNQESITDAEEKERDVRELLDKDLEGCCRPLRIRVQHTIKSQNDVIISYKIYNLLQFYLITMKRTIGSEALLSKTLKEITEVSYKAFFDALDARGRSLLRFLHPPDADLSPPLALRDATTILREIMSVYESTLVDEINGEEDFKRILDAAVDPPMEMCRRMADLRPSADAWEKKLFLCNCVGYLQHVLESFTFTKARVGMLEDELERHVNLLTTEHYEKLLDQSGLAPVNNALKEKDAETPLSRMPAASPSAVTASVRSFDNFLTTISLLSHPKLALLTLPGLGSFIHRSALQKLKATYDEIWDAVMSKEGKYEFASTILIRGKEEVSTLLGLEVGNDT